MHGWRQWVQVGAKAGVVAVAFVAPVAAQEAPLEEVVDAPYRTLDTIWVEGQPDPLVGVILEGRESFAPRLVLRTPQGVEITYERGKVLRMEERETPESAYAARAARVSEAGDASLHRRLGDWALEQGLLREAETQFRAAAARTDQPIDAQVLRERLVELLEVRASEALGEARDALLEELLGVVREGEAAGPFSPRLALARARIELSLGLPEAALDALDDAAEALLALAPQADRVPPEEPEDDGAEDEGAPEPEDDAPERPVRRFGRDGDDVFAGPRQPRRPGGGGADAQEPEADLSAEAFPGLYPHERELLREVLSLLGFTGLQVEQLDDAQRALERLLDAWPQDAAGAWALGRTLALQGERARAIEVLEPALAYRPEEPELLLLRGRLRYLEGADALASQDLQRAWSVVEPALAADLVDPGALEARAFAEEVGAALALAELVGGRANDAEAVLEQLGSSERGAVYLARGLLAEVRGDLEGAAQLYEAVDRLGEEGAESRYCLAFALLGLDRPDDAVDALRDAVRLGYDYELAARAWIDVALARGDVEREAQALELLFRSAPTATPDLLARLGRTYVQQGRIDDAERLFARAQEAVPSHLPSLRGLAWCAYAEGDRDQARTLLQRVAQEDTQPEGRAWAQQGLRNLEEARTRRVWGDDFARGGPDVGNGWLVEATHGVQVRLVDGRVQLRGAQAGEAAQPASLRRSIVGEKVVKVQVEFDLSSLGDEAEAGVRVGSNKGALLVYRDGAGLVRWATVGARGERGQEVELGRWPASGAHVLGVDVIDPARGRVQFVLDGVSLGEAQVGALSGLGERDAVEVGVYAQGERVGAPVELDVDDVRIYVHRDGRGRRR